MDIIDHLEVFLEVAKGRSFSKAAQRLGTSRSVVTKKIARLEKEFETRLLHRNTKSVNLTETGEILLKHAESVPRAVKELKDLVRHPSQRPAGRIRVGAPPSFGAMHLAPAIQSFVDDYPAVQVTLQLDDGRSDLIAENMDLSIRIAPGLKDSNQIAYKIAVVPQVMVATDAYLEKAGTPTCAEDLRHHNCLIHTLKAPTGTWKLTRSDQEPETVQVRGTVSSNIGESLLHLARRHHGISMHPTYMVEPFISRNELRVVLPEYQCEGFDIYAVVQSKRFLPYKVRLFVDHLRSEFRKSEWARVKA